VQEREAPRGRKHRARKQQREEPSAFASGSRAEELLCVCVCATERGGLQVLQMSLASFESSKKSLLAEVRDVEAANRARESELAMQTANAEELRIQIAALNTSKATLEQQLGASSARLEALEYLMSKGRPPTDEELEELEQMVCRLCIERDTLSKELHSITDVFLTLNATVTAQNAAAEQLVSAIAPKLAMLHHEVQASQQDAENREVEIRKLNEALDTCNSAMRTRLSQLQTAKVVLHRRERGAMGASVVSAGVSACGRVCARCWLCASRCFARGRCALEGVGAFARVFARRCLPSAEGSRLAVFCAYMGRAQAPFAAQIKPDQKTAAAYRPI
jgi:predicted  nucleic acid-binding Zn-ribbon protein